MHGRKGPSKVLKKPARQSVLQEPLQRPTATKKLETEAQVAPHEMKLEPITDKRSYDRFVKTIALRVYAEFEASLRSEGVPQPETALVGFDMRRSTTPAETRMADYVALNARLIVEKAFVDLPGYATQHMPRAMRQLEEHGGELVDHVEARVRHDLMMEIRAIAMQHLPEDERYRYVSKLKEL